jgi:hypothetical protein
LTVRGPLPATRVDALACADFSFDDREQIDCFGIRRGDDADVRLRGFDALPAAEIGEPPPVDGRGKGSVLTPSRRRRDAEERADDE